MSEKEIPKVVLNFNQVNNPTQINTTSPNENSIQTIGRKVEEIKANPDIAKDFIVDTTNSFWDHFFKGAIVAVKVFVLPAFLFFFLTLTLLSSYKFGVPFPHAAVNTLRVMVLAISTVPEFIKAIFPLIIIYGVLGLCTYIAARSLGKILYKDNPEKAKNATRAIFITQMMLSLKAMANHLKDKDTT